MQGILFYILFYGILLTTTENAEPEEKKKAGTFTRGVKQGKDVVLFCDLKGKLNEKTSTVTWEHRNQLETEGEIIANKVPGRKPFLRGVNRYDFNTSNWALTILKISSSSEGYYICYVKRNITAVVEQYVQHLYISACTVKSCTLSMKNGNMVLTFLHPSHHPGMSFVDVDVRAECNDNMVDVCTVPLWNKYNYTDNVCKLMLNSKTGHQIIVTNGTKFQSCKVILAFWKDGDCFKSQNTPVTVVAKYEEGEISTDQPSLNPKPSTTKKRGLFKRSTTSSTVPNTTLGTPDPTISFAVKRNYSLKFILCLLVCSLAILW